jgi:hypothetical protein
MTTTATCTAFTMPEKFRKTGACPHCGAPIYADASITEGENGEVLTVLPMPFYTCMCRLNLQPAVQPFILPVIPPQPQPAPLTPTWRPGDTGNPFPTTWQGENINVADDGHKTLCRTGIDWDRLCGSGGITQKLDPNIVCVL